jgi:enolase
MSQIANIHARQILDSNGNPAIEVDVITDNGAAGRASVPSGATISKYETPEIRDNDQNRYLGKGVITSVNNINKVINEELQGYDVTNQSGIDATMIEIDGNEDKSNLGANTILAVSLAVAKAAAVSTGQQLFRYIGGVSANTLPIPMINLINGGTNCNSKVDIQEFMIMPTGADTFSESLRIGTEIFQNLKLLLNEKNISVCRFDDGGFSPMFSSNNIAFEFILKAMEKAGYKPGVDAWIAIDCASSQFYNEEKKLYKLKSAKKEFNSGELIDYWIKLVNKYPIISIEDGLADDDWEGWKTITAVVDKKIQIVGDDLFTTNPQRLAKGIIENAANSIIIKMNQAGTITEAINTIQLATKNAFTSIISHRSGETEDIAIAELSVALNTGLIKSGSPTRTDRVAKYNQLLRIEEVLGNSARFLGRDFKFLLY